MLPSTSTEAPETSGLWRNPYFQKRISELDGLRGLAILFVVVWHYIACLITPQPGTLLFHLMRPLQIAWSGVDLFFVLSGFLIGGILLDAKGSPRYYSTFYMRRFHRIFPLYYVWLLIYYIALLWPPGRFAGLFEPALPSWSYPLYLQNLFMTTRETFGAHWLGITWSLAVEEQFYLLLPFLIHKLRVRTLMFVVAGAIFLAPVLRLILYFSGNVYFGPYTLLPCRADALGCGVLCAILLRHEQAWAWIARHRSYLYYAMGILFIGVVYLWWHSQGRIMSAVGYTWLALFYSSWLLLGVVEPDHFVKAVLNTPLLQQLGMVAYGVYMFHQSINSLLHLAVFGAAPVIHDWSTFGLTVLAAVATFALAKLSWRYFEKPLVKRGQAQFAY